MASIDKLLQAALRAQVEAVLLDPGRLPRFKRAGTEHEVTQQPLDGYAIDRLLSEISPTGRLPEPIAGARFAFDYELDGILLRWTGLAGPLGWTAMATPQAALTRPRPTPPLTSPGKEPRRLPPVEQLLQSMIELSASDLFLTSWESPQLRIHGEISRLETYGAPTSAQLKELLYEIVPAKARADFEATNDARFVHEILDEARFRVHLLRDRQGVAAAVRHIPWQLPTDGALGLPPQVLALSALERGIVLVSGPAGSGRSTTLAALARRLLAQRRCRLVTVEDPIEHLLASDRGLVEQREIGAHSESIAIAMAGAIHDGCDALLLAGVPDQRTAELVLEAAASGLLVLVEAPGLAIADALEALLAVFRAEDRELARRRLARHLTAVVGQRLLRRAQGGRAYACALLRGTRIVAQLIASGQLHQLPAALAHGRAEGQMTLEAALCDLVEEGSVDAAEAYRAASDPEALLARMAEAGHALDFPRDIASPR